MMFVLSRLVTSGINILPMKTIDKCKTLLKNNIALLFIAIFCSCGPLTKTQVSTVKKYQTIMGNYTDYPLLLNEMTAELSYQRTLLFPENWNDPNIKPLHVKAFSDYENKLEMNNYNGMKSGLNVLKKYQEDFFPLFPNIYESHDIVEKSLSDLSVGIPVVGKSITDIAFRSKKAIYNEPQIKAKIKGQVIKGQEIVQKTTLLIKPFIDKKLEQINYEQAMLNKSYQQDFNQGENTSRYMLQAYRDNYRRLNLYIFNLEKISSELMRSVDLWQETHNKLIELLQERGKVDSFEELIDLQESINSIELYILNANRYKH